MIKQAEAPFSLQHFTRLLLQHRKKAAIYGLLLLIISFNLCLFLPANMHSPAAEKVVNTVQLCCFLMIGIVNVWFFYNRKFLSAFSVSGAKLAFICLLFVLMSLLLFIYYYIANNNGLIMAFASSGAFLFPFLIYQAWIEFMSIPEKKYAVWRLPATTVASGMPASAVNTMQVQVKIARRVNDVHENTFPVTVSGKLKLGKMFERFIEEQQVHAGYGAIEINDKQHHPYGWQFYEERWNGFYNRILNPGMSLLENGLHANAKIIVLRISEAEQQK